MTPARWSLWSNRPAVVALVLVVVGVFLSVSVAGLGQPVTGRQWAWFGALVAGAMVCGELSIPVLRRESRRPSGRSITLHTVWLLPGAVLLTPGLVAALVVALYLHQWTRVGYHPVHREVFNAATLGLSSYATMGMLALLAPDTGFAELSRDTTGLMVVLASAATFFAVNTTLVAAAVALSSRRPTRGVLGTADDNGLDVTTFALGSLLAWALVDWPPVAVLIVGITLFLYRTLLIRQLREAARTDSKTGLLNHAAWHESARLEVVRARRHDGMLGLLMLDIDRFKRINDEHGHLAGDDVLQDLARAMLAELRPYDLVCRFGGEEFAVLLPGIAAGEPRVVAERLRRRVAALQVVTAGTNGSVVLGGITVSIGVASYPADGGTLDTLLVRADTALYAAKQAGRNTVRTAAP